VSGLEQTVRFLPNKIVWFHLDAPSSQAGIRKPGGFDIRIGSSIKSQAKFQTAARRESVEDSMKRALLLIVVPALLVALGFAQTPAASINTDQTIKGCLGGSDGNYTVVEDSTGHIFKISNASVDFKQHLGHDVTLIGHKASGASSAAVDNSFVVTELNMISEHCAAAAAAPIAAIGTPSETATTPPAASAAPVDTTSTLAQTEIIPVAPAATTVPVPAETAVTPAAAGAPPAEIAPTPAVDATPPTATVSTRWDKPVADAAHPTRLPATSRRLSAKSAEVATTPAVTASTPFETASTPAAAATPVATANAPAETASTPDAAPTTPARHGALFLLILLAVLVIVMGTLVPFLGRWRKRKMLERTGAQNLSFTREASSDQDKGDQQGPRKAA
jgi:hypothetical protein